MSNFSRTVGGALWSCLVYLLDDKTLHPDRLDASPPPTGPPPGPPTRRTRLLSPVSPGVPLRYEKTREKQFARDNAWFAYIQKLIEYGSVTEAGVIMRKIEGFWEKENPPVELPPAMAFEAREYVEGEYKPPPPPPPPPPPAVDHAAECLLEDLGVEEPASPEVSNLILLLNSLTAQDVLTWSLTHSTDTKSYPDGWCWKISVYQPTRGRFGSGRTTVTRFMSTWRATQLANGCLAEMAGDEANPDNNREDSAHAEAG